jgi:hypothetical protein
MAFKRDEMYHHGFCSLLVYTKQSPPFTFTVLPVDQRLPSSDKNATICAMLLTSAILALAGISFIFVSHSSSTSYSVSRNYISVSIGLGLTQFTVALYFCPSSYA